MRAQARAAGACACRTPVSEAYISALLADLDEKGARAIGVDLLLAPSPDPAARAVLKSTVRTRRAPVIGLMQGDVAAAGMIVSDATLGQIDDFDSVLRRHDPTPGPRASLPAALAQAIGARAPSAPFPIRWRDASAGRPFGIYPAAMVAELPPDWIAGAIVLIGRLETDRNQPPLVEDEHLTPLRMTSAYHSGMAGVEAHAHILAQILAGDHVRAPGPLGILALTALAAMIGAWLGQRGGGWRAALSYLAASLAALGAILVALYAGAAILAPFAAPALAVSIAALIANRWLAGRLQAERTFLRRAFAHYLAPDVIDAMVADPGRLNLSAERRDIAVISTDIAGFTALVHDLAPDRLSALMNAYFDGMIAVLWAHGAMVDKMIGDWVLALIGAPQAAPDHAARAIACARSTSSPKASENAPRRSLAPHWA
jgi:adenylate cyclase